MAPFFQLPHHLLYGTLANCKNECVTVEYRILIINDKQHHHDSVAAITLECSPPPCNFVSKWATVRHFTSDIHTNTLEFVNYIPQTGSVSGKVKANEKFKITFVLFVVARELFFFPLCGVKCMLNKNNNKKRWNL